MKRKTHQQIDPKVQFLIQKLEKYAFLAIRPLLILVAILLTLSLFKNVSTIVSADKTIEERQQKLNDLKAENERLQKQVEIAQSPQYKEQQARERLGLAREGETVVVLPGEEVVKNISPVDEAKMDESLPDPNWKKWMKLFL